MKLTTVVGIFTGLFLFESSGSRASAGAPKEIATITKFFGKVSILSLPGASGQEGQTRALFEGINYVVEAAKMGSKVYEGSVIQTKEKAMARLVFDNGDQVMVAALSSYKISSEKKPGGEDKPVSDLLYGKFRAVISKEGPRKEMEVRTRTMVMGIRGTDFHVAASDPSGASVVSVLRGAVAVAQRAAGSEAPSPPISVAAGFSAKIPEKPAADQKTPKEPPVIAVNKTDKVDLKEIQQSISFKQAASEGAAAPAIDPEMQKKLAKLEELAVVTTKSDIKASDPELYKRIEAAESSGRKVEDLEVLQEVTVEKAIIAAPEAPPEKMEKLDKKNGVQKPAAIPKPSKDKLKEMEEDVYDKYFKK